MIAQPWLGFAVVFAVGLLIGIDRERTKDKGAIRRLAGIRTFTLASLLGAASVHVSGVGLLIAVEAGVIGLCALSALRRDTTDPGVTTEVGLMAMPILGALALSDALLTGALASVIAVLFAAKTPPHRFARDVLTDAEIKDGLIFAIATLVIWPLLPDHYTDPLDALNSIKVWLLVILMLALSASGHAATRALGARFGLPLAGLASGVVSSTATIGSMGVIAKPEPASLTSAVAGATFSTLATFAQRGVLLATVSPPVLILLAPSLVADAITVSAYGAVFAFHGTPPDMQATPEPGRAFSPWAALGGAAMVAAMLMQAAALRTWLGEAGVVMGALAAGLVDTHSAAVSTASLAASGRLVPHEAVLPILAALSSNGGSKIAVALGIGSRAFAWRAIPGGAVACRCLGGCAWTAVLGPTRCGSPDAA